MEENIRRIRPLSKRKLERARYFAQRYSEAAAFAEGDRRAEILGKWRYWQDRFDRLAAK